MFCVLNLIKSRLPWAPIVSGRRRGMLQINKFVLLTAAQKAASLSLPFSLSMAAVRYDRATLSRPQGFADRSKHSRKQFNYNKPQAEASS